MKYKIEYVGSREDEVIEADHFNNTPDGTWTRTTRRGPEEGRKRPQEPRRALSEPGDRVTPVGALTCAFSHRRR